MAVKDTESVCSVIVFDSIAVRGAD